MTQRISIIFLFVVFASMLFGATASYAALVTVTDKTGIEMPAYNSSVGCGPLAAASLFGYWDLFGYEELLEARGWGEVSSTSNITSELSIIGGYLYTNSDGWTNSMNMPGGMEGYALNEAGYEFNASNNRFSVLEPTALPALVMSEIDNGRPLIFLVDTDGDEEANHFVPVFGYGTTEDGILSTYGFYTNQSENETPVWKNFLPAAPGVAWGINLVTTFSPVSDLNSVPIPGSLLMLASGLLGFVATKLRRSV